MLLVNSLSVRRFWLIYVSGIIHQYRIKKLPNSSLTLSTEDLIRLAMSMKVTIDAVMDKGSIVGRDG